MKKLPESTEYWLNLYKEKFGIRYPLTGTDVKIGRILESTYGADVVKALMDEFMKTDYNFVNYANKTVTVPHDLRTFQRKLTVMLEEGKYKKRIVQDKPEGFDFGKVVKAI